MYVVLFKQKTAYVMRISDWSSDVCSSDLLIVEAVFEDTAIKAETTRKTEAVIRESAVFASNTSTLPISQLAQASKRPDQFIGIHFFSPVDRMGLVEVIMGKQTSKEALAKALDYIAQLRKTPIRSEEHTSELQSLMRISYAVFCLKKKKNSD